ALQTRRLYLDTVDSVFARVSSGGTAAWYLPDRLGSIRNVVDSSGALIDTIAYDGFGVVTSESSPSSGDRYKFTGRVLDSETGFRIHDHRYVAPPVGRWTTEDPLGLGPDSNPYRYVANQPTNATDPSGQFSWASPVETADGRIDGMVAANEPIERERLADKKTDTRKNLVYARQK